jgi:hypothetical protein
MKEFSTRGIHDIFPTTKKKNANIPHINFVFKEIRNYIFLLRTTNYLQAWPNRPMGLS